METSRGQKKGKRREGKETIKGGYVRDVIR